MSANNITAADRAALLSMFPPARVPPGDVPAEPPRMLDCMLDLETMGNGPHAAIVAIGAVLFDGVTEQLGESFYCRVDLASAVNMGGVIDADTVQWWLRQSADAREHVDGSQPSVHISVALADFAAYIATHSNARRVRMWGNGAAFDNVILASAYRRAGIVAPWRYSNDRCYRTVKADHPDIELQRNGTHHNALDDAITQARHLIEMRNSTTGQAAATKTDHQQPSDEDLRAVYLAAAPEALAWPWPAGLRAVIRTFGSVLAAPNELDIDTFWVSHPTEKNSSLKVVGVRTVCGVMCIETALHEAPQALESVQQRAGVKVSPVARDAAINYELAARAWPANSMQCARAGWDAAVNAGRFAQPIGIMSRATYATSSGAGYKQISFRFEELHDAEQVRLWAVSCGAKAGRLAAVPAAPALVPLTDEQIRAIDHATDDIEVDSNGALEFARAIERAHGITTACPQCGTVDGHKLQCGERQTREAADAVQPGYKFDA